MIMNNALLDNGADPETQAEELRKVTKVAKQVMYSAQKEQKKVHSEVGEAKIDELMQWFVSLEGPEQQNFIRNMIADKFRGS